MLKKSHLQESVFDNYFIRIGAERVWKNYDKAYTRYLKDRNKCEGNIDKDKLKECQLIVDLKILMLKIKTLRQAMSYCKNVKKPDTCRKKLGKIIARTNELMKIKRDALEKLHRKMDEKYIKQREENRKNKLNQLKVI